MTKGIKNTSKNDESQALVPRSCENAELKRGDAHSEQWQVPIFSLGDDNAHIIGIFSEAVSSDSLRLQGRWTLEGIVISITAAANVVGACAKGTYNVLSEGPDDQKERNNIVAKACTGTP